MNEKKTNYSNGEVTTQNRKEWNDYTVLYEINLCREALHGDEKYNMPGILGNKESPREAVEDAIHDWSTRLYMALEEARRRKILPRKRYQAYKDELDLQLLFY
ncbi:MAG: hypothetical protein DRP08_03495 [Candidatus Aenigmatarchaeota archaeon]|nr:MAG: hypothetical protein DRP08_03495 [Candidatus Aenigmarchaeota archaeon]